MKIQSLAIMFIIIVLPISIVMQTYIQNRVETLSMQSQYDSKLTGATYDALKAYQINSFNSDTSYLANSKMRDIEAGVNTFFNSLATNFSTLGYNKESLQGYVPAVVFTMYDGYYIYSPYTNTWDDETKNKQGSGNSFQDGDVLYGIKPYIYYSCRYINGSSTDVVITYSMDNYVSIHGKVDGEVVSIYGYLLENVEQNGNTVKYNNVTIDEETVLQKEKVCIDGETNTYEYVKENGTKYYKSITDTDDNGKPVIFTILNGKKQIQKNYNFPEKDESGKKYYMDAAKLKSYITSHESLKNLTVDNAVDIYGYKYSKEKNPFTKLENDGGKIFDYGHSGGIEAEDSNFNTHRVDVIKYTIERNLSVAIKNYNNYSGAEKSVDFQMPQLKDSDWMKIIDNISIITFLQGMNVGGKIYNGYSVITNTKNEDVVSDDSIYIETVSSSGETVFHRPTESGLANIIKNATYSVGVFNIDTERRTGEDSNGKSIYYYPKEGTLSYDSIVTQNNVNTNNTMDDDDNIIKKLYYTALGRERYGQYRENMILKDW